MSQNEGEWDRALRVLAGIVLLYAALDGYLVGAPRLVAAAIGVVVLVTGLAGYCPAYAAFGVSTARRGNP